MTPISTQPSTFLYSGKLRVAVTVILVIFCTTAFLGFSLYIDVKPAHAIFGIDDIIKVLKQINKFLSGEYFDNLKGVFENLNFLRVIAKGAAIMIVVKFSMDMIKKLESHHTIGNILYYSDALEYDQYIGDQLNKQLVNRTPEQVIDTPAATNLSDILGEFNSQPIVSYSPEQVRQIAQQKDRGGGLTDEQEAMLIRGAAALATSQVQCGGVNHQAIRNVAIYNAARAARFNPNQIDPRGGSEFYRQLGAQGNPYANVDFQEQVLRDFAASAEAEARRAGTLELLSDGSKSLRGLNSTNVTRTGATITNFIATQAQSAMNAAIASEGEGDDATDMVKSIVNSTLNVIQGVLFSAGSGRIINERGFCGTGRVSDGTYDDPVDIFDPDTGFITANGQGVTTIDFEESATLNWSTGRFTGSAEISGVGPVANTGTLQVTPTETTVYTLSVAARDTCRAFEDEGECFRSPGQALTNLIRRLTDLESWMTNGNFRDDTYYAEYVDLIDVLDIVLANNRNILAAAPDSRVDKANLFPLMDGIADELDVLLGLVARDPRPENFIQTKEQALIPNMDLLVTAATSLARSFRGEIGEDADRVIIGSVTVIVQLEDEVGDGGGGDGVPGQCKSPHQSEIRSSRVYQSNILNAFDEVYEANPQLADDTSNSHAVAVEIVGLVVANLAAKGFEVGTTINCNGVHHPEQAIVIGQRPGDDMGENYDTLRGTAGPPTGETFRQKTQANYIDHASWNRCVGNSCN